MSQQIQIGNSTKKPSAKKMGLKTRAGTQGYDDQSKAFVLLTFYWASACIASQDWPRCMDRRSAAHLICHALQTGKDAFNLAAQKYGKWQWAPTTGDAVSSRVVRRSGSLIRKPSSVWSVGWLGNEWSVTHPCFKPCLLRSGRKQHNSSIGIDLDLFIQHRSTRCEVITSCIW